MAREMLEGEGVRNPGGAQRRTGGTGRDRLCWPIHLLLTDVEMPGARGQDLAQQLGLQRPAMKVLYMSVFSLIKGQQQFSDAESGLELSAPIILKPFTTERLMEKVRDGTSDEAGLSL
jgi:FixJ family two-component response regulator